VRPRAASSPASFRRKRPTDAHGMWRAYFKKWEAVTRLSLDLPLLELMPELQKYVPPAKVMDKPVYSAFSNSSLHRKLQQERINTLIITGSETDVCVLSTVLGAVDLGYRIIVVKDALCSSADDSHDALVALYARRFDLQVELTGAEMLLDVWRG
jgi:nicotinamidase-related amidase